MSNIENESDKKTDESNEGGLEQARQAFLNKKKVVPEEIIPEDTDKSPDKEESNVRAAEFTEIEKEAIKQGWLPEEDFWGDKSKWKPAEDWVKNTDYYERQSQKKRLETIERQQRELLDIIRRDRAEKDSITLISLKERRREAIRQNDVATEDELDRKIMQLQGESSSYTENTHKNNVSSKQDGVTNDALEFAERNKSWFNQNTPDNTAMMAYAISTDAELGNKYPNMPISDRFERVESMVAKRFNTAQPRNILQAEPRRASTNVRRDYTPTYADVKESAVKELVDHYISRSEFTAKHAKGKYKPMTRDEYTKKLFKEGTIDKNGNLL